MRWPKNNITANDGIIYVQQEVNNHGSIFRPVHQESDVGIDGFIEYVENENASGQIAAVQIKSGDSYLNFDKKEFVLAIDDKHLEYWNNFSVPVLLIFYSPSKKLASYIDVQKYIRSKEYHYDLPIKKIKASLESQAFNADIIEKEIKKIIGAHKDEKILIDCAEKCIQGNVEEQVEGFLILSRHPYSKNKKIVIYLAKMLLLSSDIELAKDALFTLGYGVGRLRWSWNPNNKEKREVIRYAVEICASLSKKEFKRIIELVSGEPWSGPQALGERAFDVLTCSDEGIDAVNKVLGDVNCSLEIRAFCLLLLNGFNEEEIIESGICEDDEEITPVLNWIRDNY
jgi:hypothetical protein